LVHIFCDTEMPNLKSAADGFEKNFD